MTTVATLCYLFKDEKILLIKKKKRLGAGKWNGPGGRVEEGESVKEAAIRETEEEIGLKPIGVRHIGINKFYLENQLEWIVHIFVADKFEGTETETEEARPEWFAVNDIPYDSMWADDRIWMPLVLEGKKFKGKFYYDKNYENLFSHDIEILENSGGIK